MLQEGKIVCTMRRCEVDNADWGNGGSSLLLRPLVAPDHC